MAEIKKDYVKDGIRTIIFMPYEEKIQTKDRGDIGLSVVFVATNDKVQTKYSFCVTFNTIGKSINIPNDKCLLFYDEKKNFCVLDSGYCPEIFYGYMKDFNSSYSFNHTYVIGHDKVDSLKSLVNWTALRIETDTSFIESRGATFLYKYLRECIEKAEKAIKNTSETFLDIPDSPFF